MRRAEDPALVARGHELWRETGKIRCEEWTAQEAQEPPAPMTIQEIELALAAATPAGLRWEGSERIATSLREQPWPSLPSSILGHLRRLAGDPPLERGPSWEVSEVAFEILGARKDPRALPILARALREEGDEVRRIAAIRALGRYGAAARRHEVTIADLVRTSEDGELIWAGAIALDRIRGVPGAQDPEHEHELSESQEHPRQPAPALECTILDKEVAVSLDYGDPFNLMLDSETFEVGPHTLRLRDALQPTAPDDSGSVLASLSVTATDLLPFAGGWLAGAATNGDQLGSIWWKRDAQAAWVKLIDADFELFVDTGATPLVLLSHDDDEHRGGAILAVELTSSGDVALALRSTQRTQIDAVWRVDRQLFIWAGLTLVVVDTQGSMVEHTCGWMGSSADRYIHDFAEAIQTYRSEIDRCLAPLPAELVAPCYPHHRPFAAPTVGLRMTVAPSGKVIAVAEVDAPEAPALPEVARCLATLAKDWTLCPHQHDSPVEFIHLFAPNWRAHEEQRG